MGTKRESLSNAAANVYRGLGDGGATGFFQGKGSEAGFGPFVKIAAGGNAAKVDGFGEIFAGEVESENTGFNNKGVRVAVGTDGYGEHGRVGINIAAPGDGNKVWGNIYTKTTDEGGRSGNNNITGFPLCFGSHEYPLPKRASVYFVVSGVLLCYQALFSKVLVKCSRCALAFGV